MDKLPEWLVEASEKAHLEFAKKLSGDTLSEKLCKEELARLGRIPWEAAVRFMWEILSKGFVPLAQGREDE